MSDPDRYRLLISPTARRQLAEVLPESVAFAAHEFLTGPLLQNPRRVGKRLQPPLNDRFSARRGTYCVIYGIDEESKTVTVLAVSPRSDAYRRPCTSTAAHAAVRAAPHASLT